MDNKTPQQKKKELLLKWKKKKLKQDLDKKQTSLKDLDLSISQETIDWFRNNR